MPHLTLNTEEIAGDSASRSSITKRKGPRSRGSGVKSWVCGPAWLLRLQLLDHIGRPSCLWFQGLSEHQAPSLTTKAGWDPSRRIVKVSAAKRRETGGDFAESVSRWAAPGRWAWLGHDSLIVCGPTA